MKYIRTKDGIFELIWNVIEKNGKQFIIEKYDGVIYEEEAIKQADTIEELCDEFISNYHQPLELKSAREKIGLYKDFVVYGAVWTDKGLIYVAKMNDKGELELL